MAKPLVYSSKHIVRLTAEDGADLKSLAEAAGLTPAELARDVIARYLARAARNRRARGLTRPAIDFLTSEGISVHTTENALLGKPSAPFTLPAARPVTDADGL